jgi:hypothetical protein
MSVNLIKRGLLQLAAVLSAGQGELDGLHCLPSVVQGDRS